MPLLRPEKFKTIQKHIDVYLYDDVRPCYGDMAPITYLSVPLGAYGHISELLCCKLRTLQCAVHMCILQEKGDAIYHLPMDKRSGHRSGPNHKALMCALIVLYVWNAVSQQMQSSTCWLSFVRERLQRVKSHLNIEIVRKYVDGQGQQKVVPWFQSQKVYRCSAGLFFCFYTICNIYLYSRLIYKLWVLAVQKKMILSLSLQAKKMTSVDTLELELPFKKICPYYSKLLGGS